MKIGTIRIEEARAYDSHAGHHQFHAPETQEPLGSFKVLWHDGDHMVERDGTDTMPLDDWREPEPAGWYWVEGPYASGPFAYSYQAHQDADEWSPEYDD
jgi:hypothetical protein